MSANTSYTKNKSPQKVVLSEAKSFKNGNGAAETNELNKQRSSKTLLEVASDFLLKYRIPKAIRKSASHIYRFMMTKGVRFIYRNAGLHFLNKAQTVIYLEPYQLSFHPANTILLEKVIDLSDLNKQYYPQNMVETEPVQVWGFDAKNIKAKLLPYGGIILNNKVLCTDTNNDDYFRNLFCSQKGGALKVKTLIAPWSHYLDGFMWGGYYDFVFWVAAKLSRIKDALPESVFNEAIIAYPLFNTSYEREYLSLLGIETKNIIDSRTHQITFEQCIVGNSGHWFYPNAADIYSLCKHVHTYIPITDNYQGNRVYISRACRRSIHNESALIDLLKKYDFQIIDDKSRSVKEQIEIYQNARIIIGPHGASFSNIIWCKPGAHLFELFSATYTPDYFRYLAELMGLHYSAYCYGPLGTDDWVKGLEDNIYVDIEELDQCLNRILPVQKPSV